MSGEVRIVRWALVGCAAVALPAAALVGAFRGPEGAASVLIAAGIVVANAALAAGLCAAAARLTSMGALMISLPSFAFRMLAMLGVLAALNGRAFVDEPVFALSFGVAVTLVIAAEAVSWSRTPWIGMTLKEKA